MDAPPDDPIGLEAALASGVPAELLVPCDVAGLLDVAHGLRVHAAVLDEAGASLSRVEVTSWRGRAADGFTDVLAPEPARWRAAADGFEAGATALEGFVAAIPSARSTAGDAITLWQRYLAAAAATAALAGVPAPPAGNGSLETGARIAQQQQAAAAGAQAAAMAAGADAVRRQAIATLGDARRQVQSAGDVAAAALARASDSAPQARRFWESTIRPADIVGTGHTSLDALGMVPAFGAIPDAVNASWYAMSGDGVNAAISAAGMVPILGAGMIGGRFVRNATRPIQKFTEEVANPLPERLYVSGSRSPDNMTPRSKDLTGLSTFDNTDADIFRPGAKVQEIDPRLLKDLEVHGPDGPDGHHSIRPREVEALHDWMDARGKDVIHPYTQELIDSVINDFKMPRDSR